MKRRDIEKQLKKEAREHTPEVYDRIVYSAKSKGLLSEETESAEIYSQGNTAVVAKSRKRLTVSAVTLFIVIVACLAITLPLVLKTPVIDDPFIPKGNTLTVNDMYGMGAVSTVKLLNGNNSIKAIRNFSAAHNAAPINETTTDTETQVKSQAQKFNEYFTALDSFMGDEIVATVSEKNVDSKYPYETKLTINSKNFNGETIQNVMYFTETLNVSDDEDEEEETEYTLKGILVVDGTDYVLEGERTLEQEEGETENELKIRAYADITDKTSYVEMEHEYSVEHNETETEYVYSIYSNGVLVEQTAVSFETESEGNKEEIEYELEFRKGAARGKYVVERETENGKVTIKVKYNVDGEQGSFSVISSTDNKYSYTFADGTVFTF